MGKLGRSVPLWAMVVVLLVGICSASAVLVTFLRTEVQGTATVAVTGSLEVSPNPIPFGTLNPGASSTVAVTIRNASNRDVNVTVWNTLAGNPNLSLSVKNTDRSVYLTIRLPVGGTLNLNLVLSALAASSLFSV